MSLDGAVRRWVAAVAEAHGGIDVLYANAGATRFGPLEQVTKEDWDFNLPLGRVGQAEEVARCARFLAGDEASYVTGANLVVDGGWSAVLPS